jgi:lipopolysaccharide export system permease protein
MRFADRLVGKGLDTWVIVKLVIFNLSWMFVLVIPMATLVSTLMAFGNLSQNNEVTIMKSSGISLYRMLISPVIASIVVAYLLFLFNNEILPDANHQAKILMSDISRTKPTLSLEPGFFSQEVPSYAILARKIDQNTNDLFDLTIYDYSNLNKINVVTAKKGKIFFSSNQTKLIMSLQDGEIQETDVNNKGMYRRLRFERHKIAMNEDQFTFQQAGNYTRGERELKIEAMNYITDSLHQLKNSFEKSFRKEVDSYLLIGNEIPFQIKHIYIKVPKNVKSVILERLNTAKVLLTSNQNRIEFTLLEINNYEVEIQKKYALPVACIIFILLGAPLGIMVRKGGFGVAAGISLFFFLIYWAFLIGGEKLSDRGIISPFWGMWAGNIFFAILGIWLIMRTNLEVKFITFEWSKKLIPKSLSFKSNADENQNS